MPTSVFDHEIDAALAAAQAAALRGESRTVTVDGELRAVPYPFPSPGDWRDCWIYFLMLDRFNNPDAAPRSGSGDPPIAWDQRYNFRQGGTFRGVQAQLPYLEELGARAIWLSPVLKNPLPVRQFDYHGYGAQDLLNVDGRFASDGTQATAERELAELIDEAHARGIYVIFDIVLNHVGEVFDYVRGDQIVSKFVDAGLLNGPLDETLPGIRWLDGRGAAPPEWLNTLPASDPPGPDDAVWPTDLQRAEFFRRRGTKITDDPGSLGFVRGDFDRMRQLVVEYDATVPGQEELRKLYGRSPVLDILIRAYQYLIAKYDIDGYRIDTVKYVQPEAVRNFGNAMREAALGMGKTNFFTFGEIYDQEGTVDAFIGRNSTDGEGFGIDAALDFPLFYVLGPVARSEQGVEAIRQVFATRKEKQKGLISSHGEAGRYFVSFLDNHDQNQRFYRRSGMSGDQVTLGLGLLFTLQGIPCLYYGTEQGLRGTTDLDPNRGDPNFEWVREALWGKKPGAFDATNPLYREVARLAGRRMNDPALRYGRFYFRELSGNGTDFGHSSGAGGIVAFSRILGDREVLVVANTNKDTQSPPFRGWVVVDLDLNHVPRSMRIAYSNCGTEGTQQAEHIPAARFWEGGTLKGSGETAALPVALGHMEIQILVPA